MSMDAEYFKDCVNPFERKIQTHSKIKTQFWLITFLKKVKILNWEQHIKIMAKI